MPRAWISIGSNIDPQSNIAGAVRALRRIFGTLTLSPVYLTRAVGFEGPPFLNLIAGFDTGLEPARVVQLLGEIESSFGRRHGGVPLSSRTLDLDLLTFGDRPQRVAGKTLPREDILKYAFVLKPLAEVAPGQRHPVDGRTFGELWSAFDGDRSGLSAVDPAFLPGPADEVHAEGPARGPARHS